MSAQAPSRRRTRRPPAEEIEASIAELNTLPLMDLRERWTARFGKDTCRIRSRAVLIRIFAWQMQADAFGGFDVATERRLLLAKARGDGGKGVATTRCSMPSGTMFSREWKGMTYTVLRTARGFEHQGLTYRSLSDVARAITGTRWSRPRFFKLDQRTAAEAKRDTTP